jgi:hypothetical protein
LLGDDQRQAALEAIKDGKYLTDEELKGYEKKNRGAVKGIASACPVGSLTWNQSLAIQEGRSIEPPSKGKSVLKLQWAVCYPHVP